MHMATKRIMLPPGYRFNPTDQELIQHYLKPRVSGQELPCDIVKDLQIYGPNANPWEVFQEDDSWTQVSPEEKVIYVFVNLTKKAVVTRSEKKKNKKLARVGREQYNKKAGCGTWDGQTKRAQIWDANGNLIGEKRLLVFEVNEIPVGCNSDFNPGYWKMHEYTFSGVDDIVLCRITWDCSKKAPMKLRPDMSVPISTSTQSCQKKVVNESLLSENRVGEISSTVSDVGFDNQNLLALTRGTVEYDRGGCGVQEQEGGLVNNDQRLFEQSLLRNTNDNAFENLGATALLTSGGFEDDDDDGWSLDDLAYDEEFANYVIQYYYNGSDEQRPVQENEQQTMQMSSNQVLGKRQFEAHESDLSKRLCV